MRTAFLYGSILAANIAVAATPIDGWYTSVFGGYAYIPDNIRNSAGGVWRTDASYEAGYNVGGSLGFKSNPMRYEGELTYLYANADHFKVNNITQTNVTGYANAFTAMANIYYDFYGITASIEPYLGVGIGYAWVDAKLNSFSTIQSTRFQESNSIFAYQAMAGLTYNFAENYALIFGYRYFTTGNSDRLGKRFQANLANISAVYRFDEYRYK